jgi:hypothetical protein
MTTPRVSPFSPRRAARSAPAPVHRSLTEEEKEQRRGEWREAGFHLDWLFMGTWIAKGYRPADVAPYLADGQPFHGKRISHIATCLDRGITAETYFAYQAAGATPARDFGALHDHGCTPATAARWLAPLLGLTDFEVAVSTFAVTYEQCIGIIDDTALVDAFLDQVPPTAAARTVWDPALQQALRRWADAHRTGALTGIVPGRIAALDAAGITPAELAEHPALATASPATVAGLAALRRHD